MAGEQEGIWSWICEVHDLVDEQASLAFFKGDLDDEEIDEIDVDDAGVVVEMRALNAIADAILRQRAAVWEEFARKHLKYQRVLLSLHSIVRERSSRSFSAAKAAASIMCAPGNRNAFSVRCVRELFKLVRDWTRNVRESVGGKKIGIKNRHAQKAAMEGSSSQELSCDANGTSELLKHLSLCLNETLINDHSEIHSYAVETCTDVLLLAHVNETIDIECLDQVFALLTVLATNSKSSSFIQTVLQQLLPLILMKKETKSFNKRAVQIHSLVLEFCLSLLETTSEEKENALILFQHLCVHCPEKTEHRQHCCETLRQLLERIPAIIAEASAFLSKLSRAEKPSLRIIAVDAALIVLKIMASLPSEFDVSDPQPTPAFSLLESLRDRGSDRSANVRSRALLGLADTINLSSSSSYVRAQFAALMMADSSSSARNTPAASARASGARSPFHHRCSGTRRIQELLRRRSQDKKPMVRKAALDALSAVLLHQDEEDGGIFFVSSSDLQVFFDAAEDQSIALRKRSISALTSILARKPEDQRIRLAWLGAVLPLCESDEASVQAAALSAVANVLLGPFVADSHSRTGVLEMISLCDTGAMTFFVAALAHVYKRNIFPEGCIDVVNAAIEDRSMEPGIWALAQVLAANVPDRLRPRSIAKVFANASSDSRVISHILSALGCASSHLGVADRLQISQSISDRILEHQVPISSLSAHLQCVIVLSKDQRFDWSTPILAEAQEALSKYVLSKVDIDPDALILNIFAAGEAVLLLGKSAPVRLVTLVQALIQSSGQAPIDAVRAHAFLCLGKFCLHDLKLARHIVHLLVREMQTGTSAVVRSNVLLVMCDLCRTFTAVVDPHIHSISVCLVDEHPLVRRQALAVVIQLLQQDYIKWKGSLFFRFLHTFIDSDDGVRDFALSAVDEFIAGKWPHLFANHFVQAVFYLNGYKDHVVYSQLSKGDEAEKKFVVPGSKDETCQLRMIVYQKLLSKMTDEERFNTASKLVHDVLGDVADKSIRISGVGETVVRDTLLILASPHIKMSVLRNLKQDDEDEDERTSALRQARGQVFSQLVRKNTMDNVIPIVIDVKRLLDKSRSPLRRYLMLYLKEIMTDYRNELDEFLGADKQLAAEIEFDLRQFERKQKEHDKQIERERILSSKANPEPSPSASASHLCSPEPFNKASMTPMSAAASSGHGSTPMSAKTSILTPGARSAHRSGNSSSSGACTPRLRPVAMASLKSPAAVSISKPDMRTPSSSRPKKPWNVSTPSFAIPSIPDFEGEPTRRKRNKKDERDENTDPLPVIDPDMPSHTNRRRGTRKRTSAVRDA